MKRILHTFISEAEAADMLGYKPRVFRRKVLKNILPITSRNTNGRKYQYSKEDIQEFQQVTSTAA